MHSHIRDPAFCLFLLQEISRGNCWKTLKCPKFTRRRDTSPRNPTAWYGGSAAPSGDLHPAETCTQQRPARPKPAPYSQHQLNNNNKSQEQQTFSLVLRFLFNILQITTTRIPTITTASTDTVITSFCDVVVLPSADRGLIHFPISPEVFVC